MSEVKLGPHVYESFYIQQEHTELFTQYLIMDYYPYDCLTFLIRNQKNNNIVKTVMKKMINVIYRMIFEHNLYCVDIKPHNFVIKESNLDVRMIDFGGDYCYNTLDYLNLNPYELYFVLIYQLSLFVLDIDTAINICASELRQYNGSINELIDNAIYNEELLLGKYVNDTEMNNEMILFRILGS
jgi:hypothetical protein